MHIERILDDTGLYSMSQTRHLWACASNQHIKELSKNDGGCGEFGHCFTYGGLCDTLKLNRENGHYQIMGDGGYWCIPEWWLVLG